MNRGEFVVYITIYFGDRMPRRYIGSTFQKNVDNGYNGTVCSKRWSEVYKNEQKYNKHLFRTRILSYHETRISALDEERRLQIKYDVVKSNLYINESIASPNGFFGRDVSGILNPNFGNHWNEDQRKRRSVMLNSFQDNGKLMKYNNADKCNITKINTIKNGMNTHKRAGIKQSRTKNKRLSNGLTIAENAALKRSVTVTSTTLDNGLTIAQNAGLKGAHTRKTKILNNGKTIYQNNGIKQSTTKSSPEWKETIGKEANDKISLALKNKPIQSCPHCGKESRSISNLKRWHFDKCKHKGKHK